jgi:hypothetical protein
LTRGHVSLFVYRRPSQIHTCASALFYLIIHCVSNWDIDRTCKLLHRLSRSPHRDLVAAPWPHLFQCHHIQEGSSANCTSPTGPRLVWTFPATSPVVCGSASAPRDRAVRTRSQPNGPWAPAGLPRGSSPPAGALDASCSSPSSHRRAPGCTTVSCRCQPGRTPSSPWRTAP